MSYIAINIALIPPKVIINDIIKLNSKCRGDKENFSLSYSDKIPHMTLLMGWVKENDINKINELLQDYVYLLQEGIQITPSNTHSFIFSDRHSWQYIDILPNSSLQLLYSYVVKNIQPFMIYNKSKVGFAEDESVNDITVEWIYDYKDREATKQYQPHISIGIGELEDCEYNTSFKVNSIGIYQLGNYCTCRNILGLIKLP